MVLLHGYGLDRTMWAPQLAALEGGDGAQSRHTGPRGLPALCRLLHPQAAEDLRAVLVKALPRPGACGLSMGGCVVQESTPGSSAAAPIPGGRSYPYSLDCYSGWGRRVCGPLPPC